MRRPYFSLDKRGINPPSPPPFFPPLPPCLSLFLTTQEFDFSKGSPPSLSSPFFSLPLFLPASFQNKSDPSFGNKIPNPPFWLKSSRALFLGIIVIEPPFFFSLFCLTLTALRQTPLICFFLLSPLSLLFVSVGNFRAFLRILQIASRRFISRFRFVKRSRFFSCCLPPDRHLPPFPPTV